MTRAEDVEALTVAGVRLRELIAAAGELTWTAVPVTSDVSQIVRDDGALGLTAIAQRLSPERAALVVATIRSSEEVLALIQNARLIARLNVIPETLRADLARGVRLAHNVIGDHQ